MFPIGSLLPTLALDKMGRRSTMMWGSAGLSFSMMMVAALLSQADETPRGRAFAAGSVAFFFTYMLIFGASMNCVPWVYVPEILPLHARTKGTAIGVSSNWLWNFTVVGILSENILDVANGEQGHDHTHSHQPPPMESLPDLYGNQHYFRTYYLLSVSRNF